MKLTRRLLCFVLSVVFAFCVFANVCAQQADLPGDTNLDSVVNIKDVTNLQKNLAGIVTLSDRALGVSDANGDTVINIKDATVIQKFIADLVTVGWVDMAPQWTESAYAQMSSKGTVEIMDKSHGVSDSFMYTKISVKPGETYLIDGRHYYHSFCYALTDDEGVIVRWDELSDKEVNNVSAEVTVEEGEAYLYVNYIKLNSFRKLAYVAKEEEQPVSVFQGKKLVFDGDSICLGFYGGGGYAKLIADAEGCTYENFAQGGATLASSVDEDKHSVADNLQNLPKDGDLYCFEGGINDYWKQVPLGDYSMDDYSYEPDVTTFCGALEAIFRYSQKEFEGKPVCFIITHKIQKTPVKENLNGDTFEDFYNAMVDICNKYSVPYYDAFTQSELNGADKEMSEKYLTGNADGSADGCHPNEEAYKLFYVPQVTELFANLLGAE